MGCDKGISFDPAAATPASRSSDGGTDALADRELPLRSVWENMYDSFVN